MSINDKKRLLNMLKAEFDRWEALLASLDERQITEPQLPGNRSIKDIMAHLWAWQQRSIARLLAALHDHEPEFPKWPEHIDPEPGRQPHEMNAWIYETNRDKPWSSVVADWKAGFLRFLELGEAVPEKDLLEPGKYNWLGKHPLSLVLTASYEHHHVDHYEPLLDWLRQKKMGMFSA
jgi:hypothetical protein